MALPKDTPTLEALATKNWTRPDNLFCTEITAKHLIHCYTDPARQGPRTDHVPILTTFELQSPHHDNHPTRNYNDVNWKDFNKSLKVSLALFPTDAPIVNEQDFQRTAKGSLMLSSLPSKNTCLSHAPAHTQNDGGQKSSRT